MLKTNIQIKKLIFIAVFAVFMIPSMVSAGPTGSSGSGSWGGDSWGDWGGYSPTYDYTYTPNYSYNTPSYSGSSYRSSYTPSYSNYGSSYTPSYSYGGSSYIPYTGYSNGGSSIPSSSNSSNNNTNTSSSNSISSSSAVAVNNNINNNNVYVYTTPSGNAVVYNPSHVTLNGYCNIVPTNPRLGQTVTATAYATGGIGDYSYTWSGDLTTNAYGVSTSFTSYNPGTKNITVTIRSGQEVITKTCTVTFEGNNYYNGYSSSVTTGSPVSGVYMQKITTGTPVSGVYLNDLPATGVSLNFIHYMIAVMILILTMVSTFVYQVRKKMIRQIA